MSKEKNRKQIIIHYDDNDNLVEMPTLEWAKKNKDYFNGDIPSTPFAIAQHLVYRHGFTLIANDTKVICYKLF
ncbi:MAG: hypothetical protein R2797_04705 [Gelidibacter sp.]